MSRLEDIREELYRRQSGEPPHPSRETFPRLPRPSAVPPDWARGAAQPRLLERAYFARIGSRRRATKALLATGLTVIALAAAYLGYTIFFARSDVELELAGPERLVAGEITPLALRVANRSTVALRDVVVTLELPPGALMAGASAPQTVPTRERIVLADVAPGQSEQQEVRVRFIGALGSTGRIAAALRYRPENVELSLTREAEFRAEIVRVPAVITIEAPPEISSGSAVSVSIAVDSDALAPLPPLALGVEFPPGFTLRTAEPVPLGDPPLWPIPGLASGTSTKIVLRGELTGEPDEVKGFHVRLGRYDAPSKTWILLTETVSGPRISSPLLFAQASLAGNRRGALKPGEQVVGEVRFRNRAPSTVENATVTVSFPEQFIDLASIRADRGFYDATRRQITWNPASEPRLRELAAGEEGTLGFSFVVKSSLPIRSFSDRQFTFPVTTTIASGTTPPGHRGPPLAGRDTTEFRIASQLLLTARAVYHDPQVPTSGPLPPRVGQTTTYVVTLELGSGSNDVRDVTVRAILPGSVEFRGALSSATGNVSFNEASRELVWQIANLPAATGILRSYASAVVELAITPSAGMVGDDPPLLENITASGRDPFSGSDLRSQTPDITTEIRSDSRTNATDWRVVP